MDMAKFVPPLHAVKVVLFGNTASIHKHGKFNGQQRINQICIGGAVEMSTTEMPRQDEMESLKNKLEQAEQARLSGAPTFTLEESRKRLDALITADNQ